MSDNSAEKKKNGLGTTDGYATKLLLTMTAVALLVNYVETMVIPGIPTIQDDFGTTAGLASWITSAFLVVGAATAPLFGKLGDVYGKKRMFILVLILYIVGVAMAVVSDSIYMLLAARAIQGMGFAIVPLALALLTDELPVERIGTAQGVISATFAIGATLGLVIGAYVVEEYGWRDAFMVALMISILLLVLSYRVIKKDVPGPAVKMDYGGIALLTAGITLSLAYITEGPTRGWTSMDNLALIIPGLMAVFLFFVYERRQANPLIPLPLLKIRNIAMANAIGLFSMMAMFLTFFGVTYYTQLPEPYGLGMDTIDSGLTMAPAAVLMLIIGPIAGKSISRVGPKPLLIIGSICGMLGMSMFIMFRDNSTEIMIDQMVTMAGLVLTMVPIINIITVSTPRENSAVSLGFNTMVRNIGGAIGPVVATTVMTSYVTAIMVGTVKVGEVPSSTAFDTIFALGIVFMGMELLLSLLVKNYLFGAKEQK